MPTFMRVDRKGVRIRELLFPRYLFVKLDLSQESWQRAAYVRGVDHLIGAPCGTPYSVPDRVMADLMTLCDREGDVKVESPKIAEAEIEELSFNPGDPCRVLSGPFRDLSGICAQSSKDRVTILLTMLGQPRNITLDTSMVERLTNGQEARRHA